MSSNDHVEKMEELVFLNTLEEPVRQKTKTIMSKMDMCQCEKCFLDVCALALNKLTPKYVTTRKGTILSKLPEMDNKNEMAMTVLITQCAKMVQEKPMHTTTRPEL